MQQSKMSIPTNFQGLRVSVERGEKVGNKTNFSSSGDDNANQVTSVSDQEEAGLIQVIRYNTGSIPPLVRQRESPDKIVIWGSEQQCVVPELREFEIHTFSGSQEENNEEEDDGESMRDGKDEGPMSISSSSTASSASTGVRRNDDQSREESSKRKEKRIACHSVEELDTYLSGSEEKNDTRSGRARLTGCLKESKSETNVFVSSLSTVALSGSLSSALDSSGETCLISLSSPKTNPFPNTNNPTSAQSSKRAASLDTNQNSPPFHPQEYDCPQYYSQEQRQEERGHHRNGVSYEGGLGQRRRAGFEERVLPPRRQQLVRPLCQTEMIRERSLPESKTQQTKTIQPSSIDASPESHSSTSNKKFTKSALREPSDLSHLYNLSSVSHLRQPNQAFQRETPPMEKQPTTQHLSGPSNTPIIDKKPQAQLTYRRNSSSPSKTGIESRSSTPPQSPLRTPQGSPCQQPSMYLISRNVSGASRHVPSGCNPAVPTSAQGYGNSCLRAPVKTNISTSGILKAPLCIQQSSTNCNPKENSPSPKLKPKGVRPKIITSVRKNPQLKLQTADGPYQVSSLPSRLSTYTHSQPTVALKDASKDPSKPETETQGARVLSASNPLYDKYRQGMHVNSFQPGMQNRSLRAPGHTNTVPPAHAHSHNASPKLSGRAENYYGTSTEVERSHSFKGISSEDTMQGRTATQTEGSGSLVRSSRGLRLGLGAVTRTTAGSIKARGPSPGQRSTPGFGQPIQTVSPAINHKNQDNTDDQVISHQAPAVPPAATTTSQPPSTSSRSPLSKFSQSGLRPPGFSSNRLPAGRLAAFGFVRSSSVSSASSAHSADSAQSDPCRTAHGVNVSEELPLHRVTKSPPLIDQHRGPPCRSSSGLQPPSTPVLPRRYLPPPPKSSPGVGRKEFQRSLEVTRSLPSSPKRLAVVPPKLQSPVQPGQRPAAAVRGSTPTGSPRRVAPLKPQQESLQREKEEAQKKEQEKQADEKKKMEQREEVQRLQRHCELQERQLKALRNELSRASLGLDAFIITTQHYCLKNETAEKGQRKLSLELQKAKEEMTFQSVRWERLQQDKTALEVAFEHELQELQVQQEAELAAVEESLRKCHAAELEHLKEEHRLEMEELTTQQQEQMEEVTVNHQTAMQELRDMHNITMATLHEEHARTMRDLRKAHEQQKLLLEEDFEKLKLSLQDQVDTLTFQNQSLKEKAKRFEEALRKSTDEQIIDALAPYQHIEKDLKSLKEVVEMKNQQIHQQERKISDLEKVAQKNVFLEEKIQVLQQQNEDMKARIEMNVAMSRQLSEKNANLQESVEKESTEKKRLSRNNEELLWLLQTSPLMSPASSPLHRSSFSTSPVPSSPLFSSSPLAGCDSPTHCHGCPRQAQHCSPSHRSVINQNLSPEPATPTHRAAVNYNYSSGPNTPTHRPLSGRCNSNTSLQN